jgi:hypothetical protein
MPKSAKPGNMKGVSWNSHPGGPLFGHFFWVADQSRADPRRRPETISKRRRTGVTAILGESAYGKVEVNQYSQ